MYENSHQSRSGRDHILVDVLAKHLSGYSRLCNSSVLIIYFQGYAYHMALEKSCDYLSEVIGPTILTGFIK